MPPSYSIGPDGIKRTFMRPGSIDFSALPVGVRVYLRQGCGITGMGLAQGLYETGDPEPEYATVYMYWIMRKE